MNVAIYEIKEQRCTFSIIIWTYHTDQTTQGPEEAL